ncbi:pilus assembly protein [Methylocystis parvus]|uniref:TadE/TadG family protein n=1 Tax=Methylocystis parvus TaxID=134 RepID=A0A6B8M7T6_9HYPH|nr:pilus assembly protein [Methylocystis parvus]QGM98871.1 TadE/TadG family protein [Methylocystis parvus]WBK00776.1 pilus assembly protein [Methylocystis parvus OBBP]
MRTSFYLMVRAAASSLKRLARARSGSTAIIFGLAFIPVMLGIGAAIDYGRAAMIKSKLQGATDEAVLAAGAQSKLKQSDRQSIALNKVLNNLGGAAGSLNVTVLESEPKAGVYEVTAQATMNTSLLKFANFQSITVAAKSEASVTMGSEAPVEIALALDNTGSMRDDIPALKSAAKTLVQNIMGDGSNGKVRVSVVPYVAAVNPGLTDTSMIDTGVSAPWTGNWFNWAWLGYDKRCTPNWGSGGGGSGPGGGSSGDSGDASDLINLLNPFRRIAQELFGVGAAHASDVTPNTIPTLTLQNLRSSATGRTFKAPVGFNIQPKDSYTGGCDWIVNPGQVSPYELFKRLKDDKGTPVAWKGCVEARANAAEIAAVNSSWSASYASADYDVTDAPPASGNAASLFTPYFWPDEPDYDFNTWVSAAPGKWISGSTTFHNNFKADYPVPSSWNWVANNWNAGQDILKYDGATNSAIVKETAPDTYGPNAACPQPITRLTNNQGTVISAIEAMNFWYNGGTVISEGLTWAWRTISPEKPFADGAAYTDAKTKKVIVLMTDGVNGLAENGNSAGAGISDYSAYGYMGGSRLSWADNVQTYDQLQTFLDNRLKKACDNAKAKGISIYTVMFNHNGFLSQTQQAHSSALLAYCASKPDNAYVATDSNALSDAFANISVAATATPLRLTK